MSVLLDDPIVPVVDRQEVKPNTSPRDAEPVERYVRTLSRIVGYAALAAAVGALAYFVLA